MASKKERIVSSQELKMAAKLLLQPTLEATNIRKYGEDFYRIQGAKGGSKKVPKGFAMNRELARKAGAIGGRISRKYKEEA